LLGTAAATTTFVVIVVVAAARTECEHRYDERNHHCSQPHVFSSFIDHCSR
jgi:hypothetical protein